MLKRTLFFTRTFAVLQTPILFNNHKTRFPFFKTTKLYYNQITKSQIKSLLEYSNTLLQQQKHAEAMQIYDKVISLDPTVLEDLIFLQNYATVTGYIGKPSEAIETLKKCVEMAEKSSASDDIKMKIHWNLGASYARIGNTEDSLKHLLQSVEYNNNNLEMITHIANICVTSGRIEKAMEVILKGIDVYQRLDETAKKNVSREAFECYYVGGLILKEKKNPAAIELLKSAVMLNKESWNAYYNLGEALIDANLPEEAIKYLSESIKIHQHVEKKDSSKIHELLGLAYGEMNQTDKAIQHFEEAVKHDPTNTKAVLTLGLHYMMNDRHIDAEKCFQSVLSMDENNVHAKVYASIVLEKQDKTDAAQKLIEGLELSETVQQNLSMELHTIADRCLNMKKFEDAAFYARKGLNYSESAPQVESELKLILGTALQQLQNYDEAENIFKQVTQSTDDAAAVAYYTLSFIYIYQRRFDDVVAICKECLDKGLHGPAIEAIYLNLGSGLSSKGNHDEAIKYFEEGLKHFPNSSLLLSGAGFILYNKNDFMRAYEYLKKAYTIDPSNATACTYLAFSCFYLDKSEEAIRYLKESIQLNPEQAAKSYICLATLEAKAGRQDEAKEFLNKAKEIDPQMVKDLVSEMSSVERK